MGLPLPINVKQHHLNHPLAREAIRDLLALLKMYRKVHNTAFLAELGESGIICVWINYKK